LPLYHYKAIAQTGDVLEGDIEATDRSDAIDRLQELGHLPIRAEEAKAVQRGSWLHRDLFGGRRVPRKQIALVTREMAMLLKSGLSLDQSLEVLVNLARQDSMRQVLAGIREKVRGGSSLADALATYGHAFPRYYVSMVRAGETGGALEPVLERLGDFIERSVAFRSQVASALLYPVILLIMAGISLTVLFTFVIPQFKPLFEDAGATLPLMTQIVLGVADFVESYWWSVGLVLAMGALLVQYQLSSPQRRRGWDRRILQVPALGDLLTKIQVARFSRMLGTLLANGVALLSALSLVGDTLTNTAITAAVEDVARRVKQGQGMAKPLMAAEVFPSLAVDLVRVGEETSRLDEMLLRVADIYEREAQRTMERAMVILVPALTIGLGALIAFIIGSVLLAILSVNKLAF